MLGVFENIFFKEKTNFVELIFTKKDVSSIEAVISHNKSFRNNKQK